MAVLFGGSNDPARHIDPAETRENVTLMVEWLQSHHVEKIVLIGPGVRNWSTPDADGLAVPLDEVHKSLRDVAERCELIFVASPASSAVAWNAARIPTSGASHIDRRAHGR